MRQRHEGHAERADIELGVGLDDLQLDAVGIALLLELPADQARGESGGVERHAEILGQVRQRADMVLMPVRQHDTDQIVEPFLDELQVGQDHVDAGILRIGEGDAAIDHHPLAVTAVQIDVHADLARPTQGQEKELVLRFGHFCLVLSHAASRDSRAKGCASKRLIS